MVDTNELLSFLTASDELADVKIYPPVNAAVRAGLNQTGRYRVEIFRRYQGELEFVTHHVSRNAVDSLVEQLPVHGFQSLPYSAKNVRHFRRGVLA